MEIKDITPIEECAGKVIKNKGEIKKIVEYPLQEACEVLYDKNIIPSSSSANIKNIGAEAYIDINLNNLSNENKGKIAEISKKNKGCCEMVKNQHMGEYVHLTMALNEETKVQDVINYFNKIATMFLDQDIMVGVYGIEELKRMYAIDNITNVDDIVRIFEDEGFVYDKETKLFYESKELLNKSKAYRNKLKTKDRPLEIDLF